MGPGSCRGRLHRVFLPHLLHLADFSKLNVVEFCFHIIPGCRSVKLHIRLLVLKDSDFPEGTEFLKSEAASAFTVRAELAAQRALREMVPNSSLLCTLPGAFAFSSRMHSSHW